MKKLLMIVLCVLLLAACSTNASENPTYKANEKHLQNIVLTGVDKQANTITFKDGHVTVVVDDVANAITPNVNLNNLKGKAQSEEMYKITSITTKGDTYTIKGESNFMLQLKREGERIFSDSNGDKYQTGINVDEMK